MLSPGESLQCPLLGQVHAWLRGAHHVVELLGPAGAVVVPGEVLGLLQDDDLCARLLRHAGQVADLEDPQQRPVIPPCMPCCAELPSPPLNLDTNCSARPSINLIARHELSLQQEGHIDLPEQQQPLHESVCRV